MIFLERKLRFHLGETVYVPSPSTVLVVEPSSKVAGVSSSIGTFWISFGEAWFYLVSKLQIPDICSGARK